MIAKASTISHGANGIRYSVNKEKADIVKANFLPDDISPEAMYGRMMLVQKKFAENINKGRPLSRNVIRIEISPSEEESRDWTMIGNVYQTSSSACLIPLTSLAKPNGLLQSRSTSKARNT